MNLVHKPTPLREEGSFEPVVNARTAQRRAVKEMRQIQRKEYRHCMRTLLTAPFALTATITVTLGFLNLLVNWIAAPVAVVLLCAACFFGGNIWRVTK